MKLNSLQDLLIEELKDIYHAENQLIKALPKMAKAATHPELRSAFEEHLEQTKQQKNRLEAVFESMGRKVQSKVCEGMKGIIEENESMLEEEAEDATRDAALIAGAQKVEHYEIASYGTVRAYAQRLGFGDAAELLQQTLEEEETTDRKLTELAEMLVNPEAADEDEDEDSDTEAMGKQSERAAEPARARAKKK